VLDILPKRHVKKTGDLARTFSLLREGSIVDRAEYHILKGTYEGMRRATLAVLLGTEEKAIETSITELTGSGKAILIGRTLVHSTHFSDYKARLQALLTDFHAKNPLKVGISKEELRTRLPKVEPHIFQVALEELLKAGQLELEKDKVFLRGAARPADKSVQQEEEQILKKLQRSGLTPPTVNELSADMNIKEASLRDMLGKLAHEGKAAKIKGDMYFHAGVIDTLKKKVIDHLEKHKEMMPSDFKNITGVSRKYMIPLLEYFDETRLTIRSGDKRVLRTV
jgi:selenocysteine-specific elongation factor